MKKLAIATALAGTVVSFSSMATNTGTINFEGSVVNTPCNIEQSSTKQTVDFGQLSRKALESGVPAEADFEINFTGCDFTSFSQTTGANGQVTTNPVKTMSLTFTGQTYADTAKTMLTTSAGNANNLGIAIDGFTFGTAQNVLPRISNEKGDNTLRFKALAKAVDAKKTVGEGRFSSIANFRITYQ